MNAVESTTEPIMFALSPLLWLRISCRRVANTWRESESMLALTVLGAFVVVLVVPVLVILWRAVR